MAIERRAAARLAAAAAVFDACLERSLPEPIGSMRPDREGTFVRSFRKIPDFEGLEVGTGPLAPAAEPGAASIAGRPAMRSRLGVVWDAWSSCSSSCAASATISAAGIGASMAIVLFGEAGPALAAGTG